jgi:outer membrane protein assembly factor BamB
VAAKVYALDAASGSTIWESEDTTTAGPYCGVVFAPDGDPIIGSNIDVKRIDAATGATVWSTSRNCSVSGQCGAAISGDGVYVVEVVAGGQAITRLDLATGARQYQSPVMGPAFTTVQNTPMAGPDGSLYLSRTMNNPTNDRFFAFRDTGTEIVAKWDVPAGWSTSSEFAIGDDGSVYMEAPGDEFVRLDPDDGSVTATTGVLAGFGSPRVAIDGAGNVYLSNKSFADGRVYAFTDDLQPIWDAAVTNINIGGPALGRYGTLVVVGNGTIGRAYRLSGAAPACPDLFSDGYETGTTELWSDQEPEP